MGKKGKKKGGGGGGAGGGGGGGAGGGGGGAGGGDARGGDDARGGGASGDHHQQQQQGEAMKKTQAQQFGETSGKRDEGTPPRQAQADGRKSSEDSSQQQQHRKEQPQQQQQHRREKPQQQQQHRREQPQQQQQPRANWREKRTEQPQQQHQSQSSWRGGNDSGDPNQPGRREQQQQPPVRPQQSTQPPPVWPQQSTQPPPAWPQQSTQPPPAWPQQQSTLVSPQSAQPSAWPRSPMKVETQQGGNGRGVWHRAPNPQMQQQGRGGPPRHSVGPPPERFQQPQGAWRGQPPPQQQQQQHARQFPQQVTSPQKSAWGTTTKPTPPQPQPQQVQPQYTQQQKSPMRETKPIGASPSQLPSQQSLAGIEDITESMKSLDTGIVPTCPRRRDRMSKTRPGRQIIVETNHLKLNFKYDAKKYKQIIHYDVSVEPERRRDKDKFYRKVFEKVRSECFPNNFPAFDGKKNAYSIERLPIADEFTHKTKIREDDRDKEVVLKIKYAATVDLTGINRYIENGASTSSPQDAIQALDIVLRQPSAKKFVQLGRSYFTPPPGKIIELGEGYSLWYGFFQSAIVGWKMYLNVDVAHKGFAIEDRCIDALIKITRKNDLSPQTSLTSKELETFFAFIKNLYIVYDKPPRGEKRTYKVGGLGEPADRYMFEKNGEELSVLQHFLNEYRYVIKYPKLPCLQCGPGKRIALPMELCRIAKEQHLTKMSDNQTRNMVRAAAVPPSLRKQKIEASMREIGFNMDPCIKEFGITVDSRFTEVSARILDPPKLEYSGDKVVEVTGGVWRSGKFQKAATLMKWAIYSSDQRVNPNELRDLANKLKINGKDLGMSISDPLEVTIMRNPRNFEQDLHKLANLKCQVVFIILSDWGPVSYNRVKKVAEMEIGMLTQCIRSRTLQKLSPPTAVNILLKLNAKLNGVNHSIKGCWPSFLKNPVMVVGADVTHPAPGDQGPSIAAVAASYDPKACCYNMIWKKQTSREEMIIELEDILSEQLLKFYQKTGHKPQAILFYRDGVSEGQFQEVIDKEVKAIQRACKRRDPSGQYEPQITFLVVQKRHHTRLFPGPKDGDGKNRNVPAGTVVDQDITHPTEVDFYLVSHASIQGTSRPTKYHLLYDDSNMTENELEEITYYLCHLFTRCTRSVSYPAPTYYAHLAAFRVRSYLENEPTQKDIIPGIEINRQLSMVNPMYFV